MKKLSTLLLSSLLLVLAGGQVYGNAMAADTLKGQKHFVQHVSQTVCTKLAEEDKKAPLNKLSSAEAQSLFTDVLQSSIQDHIDEMSAIMEANHVSKPRKFGEAVGRDVVLLLVKECPISQPLVMNIGMGQLKNMPAITAEEKPTLVIVATEICQRLDAENTKRPFTNRSATERQQAMETAMQGAMLKHLETLSNYYGIKAISNKTHMEGVGRKIALLLADQCPGYLTQLGLDETTK
ncbi:hypothetical protein [Hymenobacter norwichensis]|uniref:hypothetical protein n=1 Tax=Hymenobacter norwichensis TaxID=223903 RepID=UPI0012FA3354|nr:hypothetical protein [Hymenobacter norwichensis]